MVFFHNHLLYGDIAKIYRIYIMQQNDKLFFLDTIFLIHITLLQCLIVTFLQK